jgi:DnaJ-class molecular chaperone
VNHDMSKAALENGPDVEETNDDSETCEYCAGHGGWSTTHVDSSGREYDADHECPKCDGAGKR